jgi:formyltetrahydrofolate synthetase
MALYGNNDIKELNEFSDYVNNNFLNSILNEDAQNIMNSIKAYRESGEGQFELAKKIIDITDEEFKDFDNLTKEHLIEAYFEAFRYRNIYLQESVEISEDLKWLLEYSGNPIKNEEFKQSLKDVDKALTQYIAVLGVYDSTIKKFIELLNGIKDIDSCRQAYLDIVKESKAGDKNIDNLLKDAGLEKSPFTNFNRQLNRFNNKYSTTAISEKKVFDKKLVEYANKVNDTIEPWAEGGEKIEELNLAIDKFNSYMPELTDKAVDYIDSWYQNMFNLYDSILGECAFLRRKLGLERENGIIYKMVQKIFKK